MSSSDEIINFQCPICFRRFYDPIILLCGHSFDRLCIQNYIDSNKRHDASQKIPCPLCKIGFDPREPMTFNRSLNNLLGSESTYEWFIIDIGSKQRNTVIKFLTNVFHTRDIFETNHVNFETDDARIGFNCHMKFDKDLQLKPIKNLNILLQDAYNALKDERGVRKICILTDGLTKHVNLINISSNAIHQRFIVHVGNSNAKYIRRIADEINFHFEHFDEKTLDIYVKQFARNF